MKTTTLWKITLYWNNEEKLTESEKFIFQNQMRDLKNKKQITIETFTKESVFFDLFMKNQKINKKILSKAIADKKTRLSKQFKSCFELIETPSDKNYEKRLIEKLNNKFIIDAIKKNSVNDKKDIEAISLEMKNIEYLKQYMKMKNIDNLSKEMQEKLVNLYKKIYKKKLDKTLKARKRLERKFNYLVD